MLGLCPSVQVSPKTCYYHIPTIISNLFQHYILLSHGSTFGDKT